MSKVDAKEMDQYCDPKGLQDKSRKQRFQANGEPQQHPGYDNHEPSDAVVAERGALLQPKKTSNLSGAFDTIDAAAKSIKSADSGTRS